MPRRLSDEDRELWSRVARTARRLHPEPQAVAPVLKPDPGALPPPRPQAAPPLFPRSPDPHPVAPSPRIRLDLMPPLGERLAAEPLRMDPGLHRAMTRGKLDPDARIDLHGMTLAQAHSALTGFLLGAHARGNRLVLVITGKGRKADDHAAPLPARHGVLKHEVPGWLRSGVLAPLVLQVREAHRTQGGAGAYYVYLKKRRPSV
jgi:DNA-nicking Smr family endonuclease